MEKACDRSQSQSLILNNFSAQSALVLKQFIARDWKLIHFNGAYSILISPNRMLQNLAEAFENNKQGLESLNKELEQYANQKTSAIYKPNSPQIIGAGASFLAINRYNEANAIYATILNNNHFMKTAWLNYGQSLLGLRKFEEASKALEQAVKIMPNNPQALINLGQAYKLSKNESGFAHIENRLEKIKADREKAAKEKSADK